MLIFNGKELQGFISDIFIKVKLLELISSMLQNAPSCQT